NGIVTVTKPHDAQKEEPPPKMTTRIFRPRSVSATDLRWALEPTLTRTRDKQNKLYASIKELNEDSRPGYGLATLDNAGAAGDSGSTGMYSNRPTPVFQVGPSQQQPGAVPNGSLYNGSSEDPTAAVQASQVLVVTDTEAKLAEIARLIEEL